jgi:hypothetical protein
MPKFIVDLWLDGYDNEKDMEEACTEFIYQQLNMTASSVQIEDFPLCDCGKEATDFYCEDCLNKEISKAEHRGA